MKPCSPIHLLTVGAVLLGTSAFAQTTPTGTATSTTYPNGAVAPDSSNQSGKNRMKNKSGKRSRRSGNGSSASNTSTGDARYRESSSANGTAVNSSNTTNYNSNNATNAPTGAGSNPNATGTTTPNQPNNDGGTSMQSGSTGSGVTTSDGTAGATKSGATRTGTGTAIATARTSETPAVVAGSTARNTSIHDFVASSPNLVTLQNAIQAANLKDMLGGTESYTLFAPSNAAFKKLPTALQNKLLEGQNRDALQQLLSYHLVAGSLDAATLTERIKAGGGKAQLTTLAGGTLTAREANGRVTLTDEQGKTVTVETPDQRQSNGVVHGISGVLLPKNGTSAFR